MKFQVKKSVKNFCGVGIDIEHGVLYNMHAKQKEDMFWRGQKWQKKS